MIDSTPNSVRPTKRCLDNLGLNFPPLEVALHALPQVLVAKAQQVPAEVVAGSAERIRAIKDRVWFKVKINAYRGAVTELERSADHGQEIVEANAWWWIGAAGIRRDDSGGDFYRLLTAEVERAGLGSGTTKSSHLLPAEIDIRRLKAETAVQFTLAIRRTVRRAIALSLRRGKIYCATSGRHRIMALVRAKDGDAYLAVAAEGFIDPKLLAVILGSVPHVAAGDWLPEPEGVFGMTPAPGQIVYSTIISAASQAAIMDEFSEDEGILEAEAH